MATATRNAEFALARQTAEEYRRQGYEVTVDGELDFLPGVRADLIARKGDEVKVIEVKSRSSLAAAQHFTELVESVEARPGWGFELILAPEPERLVGSQLARSLDQEGIMRRLGEAQQLVDAGHAEAAFVLAWMSCEAALRHLIELEGVVDERITAASYAIEQATHLGAISLEIYDRLSEFVKQRNTIVHGFNQADLTDERVVALIDLVAELLEPSD